LHRGVSCGDPFLAAQFSRNLAGAAGAMQRRFARAAARVGQTATAADG
jgi:hypothetical protein